MSAVLSSEKYLLSLAPVIEYSSQVTNCSADKNSKRRTSLGLDSGTISTMASSQTTRDRILGALQDLPGDATFDDAIERLVFLAKVDAGLAELDEGKGIPHEEAKRRLGL